jgi:hypothetical protein
MKRAAGTAALLAAAALGATTLAAHADDKPRARPRGAATAQAPTPPRPLDGGAPPDGGELAPASGGRPVRVRLLDGSTVSGTVHAEEAQALVIDCSLGLLSIPRARISTIAYDSAAAVGQKRAPVQMLDDDGPPPKKHSSAP